MHIHANQINPNAQLDASYAAEKAAAKKETERTRKKLSEFASALAGEAGEACVVRVGANQESREHAKPPSQPAAGRRKRDSGDKAKQADSQPATQSISDWA
jgi:hypothetical protein